MKLYISLLQPPTLCYICIHADITQDSHINILSVAINFSICFSISQYPSHTLTSYIIIG